MLPVTAEHISNILADELAVLLQCVERVLHSLVDGLLYGVTHFLDLIHTLTGLWKRVAVGKKKLTSIKQNIYLKII